MGRCSLFVAMLRRWFLLSLTCFHIIFLYLIQYKYPLLQLPDHPKCTTRCPFVPLSASSPSSDPISIYPPSLSVSPCYPSRTSRLLIDLVFLVLLIILFLSIFPIMFYLPPINLFLVMWMILLLLGIMHRKQTLDRIFDVKDLDPL